jgi:exo-beta-1,3-glucanase (GH17 family)
MARDDPLDDGLAKSLFSGISRPRPGSSRANDVSSSEVQSSSDIVQTSASVIQSTSNKIQTIDFDALDQALKEAEKYPKVTAYSPELAAVMRYNEITLRRYRISTEAVKMLEEDVIEKYPEVWSEVTRRLQHKKRRKQIFQP